MTTDISQVSSFPPTDLDIVQQVFDALGGRVVLSESDPAIDIMLKAIPVFVSRGVAGTNVNNLIEVVGVSRRTFYKYYSGKVDVLETIYRAGGELFLSRVNEIVKGADSVSSLVEEAVGLFFHYHTSIGSLILLLEEEAMRSDSPLAPLRQSVYDRMAAALQNGVNTIAGDAPDKMVFYTLIWSMEAASLNLMRDQRYSIDDVSKVRQVVIHVVKSSLSSWCVHAPS
ncbi:TetR/AcrR family transcriptional regulator [Parendozoicomonas sp. Alg238-R29]|uniref:TetR/AcrR family transcriptional regulator n=1 Tax=Parendozoicomonas sp. Alg238-R29 TaxID=2993446 RepID=UPI00248EE1E5|nr:TetR/AcrR family transcriptional regulator [Parendozoicomonas sp. Alg238-R29]